MVDSNSPKYKLTTTEAVDDNFNTVYEIEALRDFGKGPHSVKAGERGGFIQSEKNLSQKGNAWVDGSAMVSEDAHVGGNAYVGGYAQITGNATLDDNVEITGNVKVSGNAKLSGSTQLSGDAQVDSDPLTSGHISKEFSPALPEPPVEPREAGDGHELFQSKVQLRTGRKPNDVIER